jgi:hypothetical protein
VCLAHGPGRLVTSRETCAPVCRLMCLDRSKDAGETVVGETGCEVCTGSTARVSSANTWTETLVVQTAQPVIHTYIHTYIHIYIYADCTASFANGPGRLVASRETDREQGDGSCVVESLEEMRRNLSRYRLLRHKYSGTGRRRGTCRGTRHRTSSKSGGDASPSGGDA